MGPLFAQRLDMGLDLDDVLNPNFAGPKLHFDRLIFKFLEARRRGGSGAGIRGSGHGECARSPLWKAVQHVPGTSIVTLKPDELFNEIELNMRNPLVPFFRGCARARGDGGCDRPGGG